MPTDRVFKELFLAGLNAKDLVHLERLSDPEVLSRMDLGKVIIKDQHVKKRGWFRSPIITESEREEAVVVKFDEKQHVIKYLRAWADMLVDAGRDDVPDPGLVQAGSTVTPERNPVDLIK